MYSNMTKYTPTIHMLIQISIFLSSYFLFRHGTRISNSSLYFIDSSVHPVHGANLIIPFQVFNLLNWCQSIGIEEKAPSRAMINCMSVRSIVFVSCSLFIYISFFFQPVSSIRTPRNLARYFHRYSFHTFQ